MASNATYIKEAYGILVGRTIKAVRPLTGVERESFGWEGSGGSVPFALILDNGIALIPSRDDEGNGAGTLFMEDLKPALKLTGVL